MKLFVQIALAAVIAAPVVAMAEGAMATAPATTEAAPAPMEHADGKMEKTEMTKTTHTKKHMMKHKKGEKMDAPAADEKM